MSIGTAFYPREAELNFFAFDERWLDRRLKTLGLVSEALAGVARGEAPSTKVVSSRYGSGLADLEPLVAATLSSTLSTYLSAASA